MSKYLPKKNAMLVISIDDKIVNNRKFDCKHYCALSFPACKDKGSPCMTMFDKYIKKTYGCEAIVEPQYTCDNGKTYWEVNLVTNKS